MSFKLPDNIQSEIVYDLPEGQNNNVMMPSVSAIPDLELLTSKILEYIEFVDDPQTQRLKEANFGEFNYIVQEKFFILPLSMIKLLDQTERREENLIEILNMIEVLKQVKAGRVDLDTAAKSYDERISEKYLYPQFGGKEAFMKKMSTPSNNAVKKA